MRSRIPVRVSGNPLRVPVFGLFEQLRDPEVEHDRTGRAVALGHEYVRGLEVAVDDEPPVGVIHGPCHLDQQPDAVFDVQCALVRPGCDRRAVDELGDEVGHAVVGLAAVEEPGDAGVVERGEHGALASEPGRHVGPGQRQRRADDLDRHGLVEGSVDAVGAEDAAHAAFADEALDR